MQGDKGDRLTPDVLTYFVVEASILWIGLNSFVKIEIALGVAFGFLHEKRAPAKLNPKLSRFAYYRR